MLGRGQSGPARRLAQEVSLLAGFDSAECVYCQRSSNHRPHDHWYGPADPMCRHSTPPNRPRPSSFDGGLSHDSSVSPFESDRMNVDAPQLFVPPRPAISERSLSGYQLLAALRTNALQTWPKEAYTEDVLTQSLFRRRRFLLNSGDAIHRTRSVSIKPRACFAPAGSAAAPGTTVPSSEAVRMAACPAYVAKERMSPPLISHRWSVTGSRRNTALPSDERRTQGRAVSVMQHRLVLFWHNSELFAANGYVQ